MQKNPKILLLNLPNPPYQRLWRDTAGGFGTAIHCSPKDNQNGEASFHPFFPYASSVLLENGYDFKIVDCQKLKLDETNVLAMVRKENPDIIISIISLPSLKHDSSFYKKIKESIKNVIIIGVGTLCNVLPEEVLQRSHIDIAVRNSYPYISNLVDLLNALQHSRTLKDVRGISYKQNDNVIHTPAIPESSVSDLPVPCYDFLELDGYETTTDVTGERHLYIPVIESKGCPYDCSYCPYPLGFGRTIMFRSPKALVDEMEQLNLNHNIKAFLLRGQTFAFNPKRAKEICEEILRRKLDVLWFCESRVDEVSKELLKNMKRAGCRRIHYGVETGDPNTLKNAKAGVLLETTKKAFKTTKEVGILSHAHIILGWPDDDRKTLENTKKFIHVIKPEFINLNFLTPYPGTKMYEIAQKSSLILTHDWSNFTSHDVVMRTKFLGADELLAIKKQIIRDVAKQNMKQLLQKDFIRLNRPQFMIKKAKMLVDKWMFPQD